ncbi:MAG: DUF7673 family protein [Steroidobacteraceae bacterium]
MTRPEFERLLDEYTDQVAAAAMRRETNRPAQEQLDARVEAMRGKEALWEIISAGQQTDAQRREFEERPVLSSARGAGATEHEEEIERLRSALRKLTNGYKYPTEVVTIAREAIRITQAEADRLVLSGFNTTAVHSVNVETEHKVRGGRNRIELTLTVSNDAQARELDAAWREIITGKALPRTEALAHGTEAIMERAREALETIERSIREHPTTGQAGRLVRFLAGVYNGSDYPFDLTDLRALDTELADACLDYLNYDRLAKREVHHHLAGGDRALHQWIEDYGIEPALRLTERQAQAFAKLEQQGGRDRHER